MYGKAFSDQFAIDYKMNLSCTVVTVTDELKILQPPGLTVSQDYSNWFIFDCVIEEIIGWHFWTTIYNTGLLRI